jgi:signal transduction histidine kinase
MPNHKNRITKNFWHDHQRTAIILSTFGSQIFIIDQDGMIKDFFVTDDFPLLQNDEINIGTYLVAFLNAEIVYLLRKKIDIAFKSGKTQSIRYKHNIQEKDFFFEMNIAATEKNEAIVILRDIGHLSRLNQVQSDFIHRATHDLRAPVSTALLMINLLENDIPMQEKREYWQLLKDVLHKESEMVEDLLSFGKLENERWIKNVELIDPIESLEKSYQSILPAAKQKNMQLDYDAHSNGCQVYADRIALEEVFTNLLSNAVKYTPQGGMVKIECLSNENRVTFRIQDSGIGISKQDLALIGSRHFRGKNALDNGIEGNGIGMFIVKTIIDHFGGDLRIESELGKGTTVSFWLPK